MRLEPPKQTAGEGANLEDDGNMMEDEQKPASPEAVATEAALENGNDEVRKH